MRIQLAACAVVGIAAVFPVAVSFGSTARVAACPMSHVHFQPYKGVTRGLGTTPWITSANGALKGHLFYYHDVSWGKQHLLGARIFTTAKERNIGPKVLWVTKARGYGLKVAIRGQRIDAPGSFSATYNGWGDYPSYVEVPVAGCWRVTVTSGSVNGRFVFSALD